ncbi:3-hydroxyacyl-CoA dehydrogenase family protein [Amycolatopsis minnesotensis]
MGSGIAALALGHGVPVLLVDPDEERLARARADIRHQLRLAALLGAGQAAEGALRVAASPGAATDSAFVIEAITENAELKAKALAGLSAIVRPGTPFVSNTSSIPIDELADSMSRPQDLAGTHFMNPPSLIGTVEVIRGPRTADETMAAVTGVLHGLGRKAVVVRDAPGFVTSRILHPMINDAARVVQAGTATADAVDALLRDCLGHRTGPLRTADLIGIDNLVDSLRVLHERTGDEGCRPCELLLAKVRAGHLGRKSGRGFYQYEEAAR